MIYITGDCHGIHDIEKLRPHNFVDSDMNREKDFLIICGDMGIVWSEEDDLWTKKLIDFYNKKNCKVLFIDGNHENHKKLSTFPIKEWNGGKVHVISNNILHLMRGQVFCIEGKTFFTMGGANSTDKQYRIKDVTWWEEEIPNMPERSEALRNLERVGNKVDFVITHTGPSSVLHQMGADYRIDEYTDWLEKINQTLEFKQWYFGHFHVDKQVTSKHTELFNVIGMIV